MQGDGRASRMSPMLLRIEFTASDSFQPMGELLPRLSTLTSSSQAPYPSPRRVRHGSLIALLLLFRTEPLSLGSLRSFHCSMMSMKNRKLAAARRYFSVALFLKSPSAGVTRYPCPVEPGLSSFAEISPRARGCPARSRVYCSESQSESQTQPPFLPHSKTPSDRLARGRFICRKASQSFAAAAAKKDWDHFFRRPVRRKKYSPPCKCGICASATHKLCARQGAVPLPMGAQRSGSHWSSSERVEFQLAVFRRKVDAGDRFEIAVDDLLGHRILDELLDGAAQVARAVRRRV